MGEAKHDAIAGAVPLAAGADPGAETAKRRGRQRAAAERRAAELLGRLFAYPGDDYLDAVGAAHRQLEEGCGNWLVAATELERFETAVAELPPELLRDLYTRTFDLSPLCIPYLSVHLFGQESFKRAQLMTGLDDAYRRAGHDRGGELPDHLGLVLRFAGAFGEEEWDELVSLCLAAPLAAMVKPLQEAANPYRHVLEGVRRTLGVSHVQAPSASDAPHWRRRRGKGGTRRKERAGR